MRRILLLTCILLALTACGGHDHGNHDHGGHGTESAHGDGAPTPGVEPYPLDTCLIMNAPLNAMGGVQRLVHAGQEWKFCCRGCVDTFRADPARWQAELAAALAAQAPDGDVP